jgi:hypothetical protein
MRGLWKIISTSQGNRKLSEVSKTRALFTRIFGVCRHSRTFFASPSILDLILCGLKHWPQCLGCGITRRNMTPAAEGCPQTCGSSDCKNALQPENPASVAQASLATASHEPSEAHLLRTTLLRNRLKLPQILHVVQPSAKTTQGLLQHENGGGSIGEAQVWIAWLVRAFFYLCPETVVICDVESGSCQQ